MIATLHAIECDGCPDDVPVPDRNRDVAIGRAERHGWPVDPETGAALCPTCQDQKRQPERYRKLPSGHWMIVDPNEAPVKRRK